MFKATANTMTYSTGCADSSFSPTSTHDRRGSLRLVTTAVLCAAFGVLAFTLSGCDGSSTSSVPNQPPNASFTAAAAPQNALEYSFDASGSIDTNTEGSIDSYQWDFGDGESASGKTVTHTYSEVGIYEVTLTVVDDDGAENTYKETVAASEPPSASFTATPDEADPTTITFDASGSSDPDGEIDSYNWTFGDGETGSGKVVTHNYDVEEDQEVGVSLTVTDGIGTSGSVTNSVLIDVPVFVPIQKSTWEVADFSSQHPGRSDRAAVLAIDGDEDTFWHTPWCCAADEYGTSRPQPPHWIVIDMGSVHTVYRLQITGRDGNYMNNPKEVTVKFANEYNGDDTNWSNEEAFTLPFDADGETIQTTISFEAPVDAQYFKFTDIESVNNDLLNLAELTAITTQEAASGN